MSVTFTTPVIISRLGVLLMVIFSFSADVHTMPKLAALFDGTAMIKFTAQTISTFASVKSLAYFLLG